MFTDIVGSTALRDALVGTHGETDGDRRYREQFLDPHDRPIRILVERHRGFEVKTIGDSFMIAFALAEDAVVCAAEIQRTLRDSPILTDESNKCLAVRIGMHTGSAAYVEREGKPDYDGHAVTIARRVEALLKGGERIYCSHETAALAKTRRGIRFHSYGPYLLKGLSEKVEIVEVLWHEAVVLEAPPEFQETLAYPWLTKWMGREERMEALHDALRQDRLVTLLGTGGVGKTRMAVETLLAHGGGLPREIVFVPLEQATESAHGLLGAVRGAIGLTEVEAPDFSSLRRRLHGGDRLFILDNFESVMRDAGFVAGLATTPGVRVLVTSQQALGLTGERVIKLEPMTTRGDLPALESYRLFIDLAQRREASWQPDDDAAMGEVLEATDGLPYLIELVAAIAPKRKLPQLAKELKTHLREVRARTIDTSRKAQHASVQACVEYSLGRLDTDERQAIARLSIFAGGFTTEAASDIAATPVAILDILVDDCLLRFERDSVRYSMLSTTRQVIRGALSVEAVVQMDATHAQWFIERLGRGNDALREKGGDAQREARRWIDTELENVLQAVSWAEQHDLGLYGVAVTAFSTYLRQTRRFSENLRLQKTRLRQLDPVSNAEAWAETQSNLANAYSDLTTGDRGENAANAIACCEAALHVYSEQTFPLEWAGTQNNLGSAYSISAVGDRAENVRRAIDCYEAASRIYGDRDEYVAWAITQTNLGHAHNYLTTGDRRTNVAKAIAFFTAALQVYTREDFPVDWATAQNNLGLAYSVLSMGQSDEDVTTAIKCCEDALSVFNARDFAFDRASAQHNLGFAYSVRTAGDRRENLTRAISLYEAALGVYNEHDSPVAWAMTHQNLGSAYSSLPGIDQTANVARAITSYSAAAQGYVKAGLNEQADTARQLAASLSTDASNRESD